MGLVLLVNETSQNWIFFCDLSFMKPKKIFCGGSISVVSAQARGMDAKKKPVRTGFFSVTFHS